MLRPRDLRDLETRGPGAVAPERNEGATYGPTVSKLRRSRRSKHLTYLEYATNTATTTQLSNQDEVEQLRNELYKWLQGDAETSVYCAKKAKPVSPLLFGSSMSPWLHLLSRNLLPSAAAPAPKEAPPLSPCSKAAERKARPDP